MIGRLVRGVGRLLVRLVAPAGRRLADRTDTALGRWRQRTTRRRRTAVLVVVLTVWLGGGAWLLTRWVDPTPTQRSQATQPAPAARSVADDRGDLAAGSRTAEAQSSSPSERLTRWAAQRNSGWTTTAVQRHASRTDVWRIFGRTETTPHNRTAVLTVEMADDGTIRLLDRQQP